MTTILVNQNPLVVAKFDDYPPEVRHKMGVLRNLMLETANEIDSISEIEETLKWGEPSYLVNKGSTVRMDWKDRAPKQYAVYFKCTTSLVETFKVIYGNLFNYEKNRAIVFKLDDEIPVKELKECIGMAFQYHTLKDKPLLGHSSEIS